MYDSILVPTDGSDHSVRAAEHGAYLARAFDATLHLLHAVDVQAAAGLFNAGGVDKEFLDRLEAKGEETINAAKAAIDYSVETTVVRGQPSEEILDYVTERDIDLVAMGTHGRTGVNRYIAGSVTERVVRLSAVPVLTVRATETSQLEGDHEAILVPTDGSKPATVAADHGIAIAAKTGARVHAINVVDIGAISSADGTGTGTDYTPVDDIRDAFEDAGRRATDAVATRAREAGVEAVTDLREGSPANTVLAYAEEHDIDLVAMGTHGRTGLQRYLLGSTTERTIRRAEMPVLAVTTKDRPTE